MEKQARSAHSRPFRILALGLLGLSLAAWAGLQPGTKAPVFTAQAFDDAANILYGDGARGGPIALSLQLASFFIGVNDPLGQNPTGATFDPNIFDLFRPWLGLRFKDLFFNP